MVLSETEKERMGILISRIKRYTEGVSDSQIWEVLGGIFVGKLEDEISTAAKLYRKKR